MTSAATVDRASADVGVTGLAVMGRNLARNLARHGSTVAVHNRTAARVTALVEEFGAEGPFVACTDLPAFVAALRPPRCVIVMVKAGEPTDAVIAELVPLLEGGDIVVDCGNAHVADTRRRTAELAHHGLQFVGAGVSGGEEGALRGPAIMVGGSDEAWTRVQPLLEPVSASVDGEPCCTHFGPDGAGHFVKMVHNGIEYAVMQLIGEAVEVLRFGAGLEPAAAAEVFRRWNETDRSSFLVELTAQVLGHVDATTDRPFVDVVADRAEQKGTGRWTVQLALDLGIPVPVMAEAVFARSLSGHVEPRTAVTATFGPAVAPAWSGADTTAFVEDVGRALHAATIVAYAQGFDEIRAGSRQYGWGIDLAAVARTWRGGCIIRARLLEPIAQAFADDPDVATLLVSPALAEPVRASLDTWRRVVTGAIGAGVAVTALASALGTVDALRAERLPAALVQGLRDHFGAHTYQRTDRAGTFHTRWEGDRTEHPTR